MTEGSLHGAVAAVARVVAAIWLHRFAWLPLPILILGTWREMAMGQSAETKAAWWGAVAILLAFGALSAHRTKAPLAVMVWIIALAGAGLRASYEAAFATVFELGLQPDLIRWSHIGAGAFAMALTLWYARRGVWHGALAATCFLAMSSQASWPFLVLWGGRLFNWSWGPEPLSYGILAAGSLALTVALGLGMVTFDSSKSSRKLRIIIAVEAIGLVAFAASFSQYGRFAIANLSVDPIFGVARAVLTTHAFLIGLGVGAGWWHTRHGR